MILVVVAIVIEQPVRCDHFEQRFTTGVHMSFGAQKFGYISAMYPKYSNNFVFAILDNIYSKITIIL